MLPNLDFIKTVLNGVNLKLSEALGIAKNAVLKTKQRLTESEKEIARDNIGAAAADSVSPFIVYAEHPSEKTAVDKTFAEVQEAILSGKRVLLRYGSGYYAVSTFVKNDYIAFGNGTDQYSLDPGTNMLSYKPERFLYLTGDGSKTYRIFISGGEIKVEQY